MAMEEKNVVLPLDKLEEKYTETVDIYDDNGNEIKVRTMLRPEEREQYAVEYCARTITEDDDIGECFFTNEKMMRTLLNAQYYTNIKFDINNAEECDKVYDYLWSSGIAEQICAVIKDESICMENVFDVRTVVVSTFMSRHSLSHNFMKSFGFVFDNPDVAAQLADKSGLTERMIDVMEVLNSLPNKNTEAKKANGVRVVGTAGNVIDLKPRKVN